MIQGEVGLGFKGMDQAALGLAEPRLFQPWKGERSPASQDLAGGGEDAHRRALPCPVPSRSGRCLTALPQGKLAAAMMRAAIDDVHPSIEIEL